MRQLSQLLERFKNLTNTDKIKKQLIVEIIESNKIPINIDQITIKNNILFIKTQSIIKTEILINKEIILKEINKTKGIENITNIQ